jgi:hypothetical protein
LYSFVNAAYPASPSARLLLFCTVAFEPPRKENL